MDRPAGTPGVRSSRPPRGQRRKLLRRLLRSGLAVIALLLSVLAGPALARAAPPPTSTVPPPTLTGKTFAIPSQGGSLVRSASGSFTYTVIGTATGPFPGAFTETGSATVDGDNGTVTAFTATFTIDAPTGQVSGTKTIAAPTRTPVCYADGGNAALFSLSTTYTATIQTPAARYTDSGTSEVALFLYQSTVTGFYKTYASAQPATRPVAPTTADQCQGGGYARSLDPSTGAPFANQGRCIQFVTTGK